MSQSLRVIGLGNSALTVTGVNSHVHIYTQPAFKYAGQHFANLETMAPPGLCRNHLTEVDTLLLLCYAENLDNYRRTL